MVEHAQTPRARGECSRARGRLAARVKSTRPQARQHATRAGAACGGGEQKHDASLVGVPWKTDIAWSRVCGTLEKKGDYRFEALWWREMMSAVQSRTAVGAGVTLRAGHVRLVLMMCETLAGRDCGRHDAMRCDVGRMVLEDGIFRVLLMGYGRDGDLTCADADCRPDFCFRDRGNVRPRSWGSRGDDGAKQSRAALIPPPPCQIPTLQ